MPHEVGNDFKRAFAQMMQVFGDTVLVHKNWNTPSQSTFEVRGMKNNEKNRVQNVMFQFPERVDIEVGDMLQLKGAKDVWRVTDTEDDVMGGVYVNFETKVEKFTGRPSLPSSRGSQLVVQGPVYGGIQMDSPHATQNVSIHVAQVDENINRLRELIAKIPAGELDREDALHALERVRQLARKDKSPGVLAKVTEKLDQVKALVATSAELAASAAPIIATIMDHFNP